MSTAEQIIAEVVREHTPMHDNGPFGDDPWTGCASKDCADWPGGDDEAFAAHVAAHVVAALTNAGRTIVEAGPLHDMVAQLAALETWARTRVEDWGDQTAQKVLNLISTETPRAAAARVAEGGA